MHLVERRALVPRARRARGSERVGRDPALPDPRHGRPGLRVTEFGEPYYGLLGEAESPGFGVDDDVHGYFLEPVRRRAIAAASAAMSMATPWSFS